MNWIYSLIGKTIRSKLDLQEDANMESKKWWQSRTIWGGVYVIGRAVYEALVITLPAIGVKLPPIPPYVDAIVGGIVGREVIKGRVEATKKIE